MFRQSVDLANPGVMWIRIVNTQEKRTVIHIHERFGMPGIGCKVLSLKIGTGDPMHIERKCGRRIDVQFPNESGAIAVGLEASWQVGCVLAVQSKAPGGQTNLAMLVPPASYAEADRVSTDDVVRSLLEVVPEADDTPEAAAAVDRAIP